MVILLFLCIRGHPRLSVKTEIYGGLRPAQKLKFKKKTREKTDFFFAILQGKFPNKN